MLDEKNENRFLNTLNDIDDDLLEEIAETPVEPEIITTTPEKSWSIRFAGPAAASLAVIAAVGIGALIIGRNISFSLGGDTTVTEIEPASSGGEQSNFQIGSGTDSTDTTPSQSTIEGFDPPNGVLSRPISEVDIPNINGYSVNLDISHDEIIQSVIIDTKKYGDYEISLIGEGVFTDYENASENIIFAHRLTIILSENNEFIDLRSAYNPLDPNASAFMLMKDHLDCYTEITFTADEWNIDNSDFLVIFRSLNGSRPIPEVLFYFVADGKLLDCDRSDLASNADRAERSEALSPDISMVKTDEGYTVYDNLTRVTYTFNLTNPEDQAYYSEGRSNFLWFKDGVNPKLDLDSIPVIDEFTYDEVMEICGDLTPPTVISEETIGGYTLSLTGMNMRKSSEGAILFYNPKTVISKDGEYIGEIRTSFAEMVPYHASIMYSNDGNYGSYGVEALIINDTLLIIDKGGISDSYFGTGCFYAVRDGKLYSLDGYWPDMTESDPPAWTEGKQDYDLIADTENQTVICGFMKFEFNFEELPAMYNYTVSWLEGPIE